MGWKRCGSALGMRLRWRCESKLASAEDGLCHLRARTSDALLWDVYFFTGVGFQLFYPVPR